jgi:Family of unknown function (DUF5989)
MLRLASTAQREACHPHYRHVRAIAVTLTLFILLEPLAEEFWYFLRHSTKWWLLPIVLILVAFGTLMLLSSTGAAPFIYTLF